MLRWFTLAIFTLVSVANAQPIPSSSTGTAQGFINGNMAAGSTNFINIGGASTNQNAAIIASKPISLSNLYVRLGTGPASGQTDVFTVYVGAAGSMSATSLTCTVSFPSQVCNDTTDVVVVPQGQSWAIQGVIGATNATAVSQFGILVN